MSAHDCLSVTFQFRCYCQNNKVLFLIMFPFYQYHLSFAKKKYLQIKKQLFQVLIRHIIIINTSPALFNIVL